MSVLITRLSDSATTSPRALALPYDVTDESRNVEHDLLDGGMAITLVTPRPGSGTFTLVYADEASARAGRGLHRGLSAFHLEDTINPSRNITYALGSGGARLSRDNAGAWFLAVSYREVDL